MPHSLALSRGRNRTFPLASLFNSQERGQSIYSSIVSALDFTYQGNLKFQQSMPVTSPAFHASKSIVLRLNDLRKDIGAPDYESLSQTSKETPAVADRTPIRPMGFETETWETYLRFHNLDKQFLQKGDFKLLDANRVDLPSSHPPPAKTWTSKMPKATQAVFEDPEHDYLIRPLLQKLKESPNSLPTPRLHAKQGHYGRILARAHEAGMVKWSIVSHETPEDRAVSNALTMTSFAVHKAEKKDRLISWPRLQNTYMPDPPYIDLPDPSLFTKLRIPSESQGKGFFLDIANMFHNIRLPDSLARFFPLTTIPFGELPGNVQQDLSKQFGRRPRQDEILRPIQTTLPMGFKWAVYIAHTFVSSCISEAFDYFISHIYSKNTAERPRLVSLSRRARTIQVPRCSVLLLHIIDDLNFVCFGIPVTAISQLQSICEQILIQHGLPIKRSKSSRPGVVEQISMTFIGWTWFLSTNIIRPKVTKLIGTCAETKQLLEKQTPSPREVHRICGKLVWLALGSRPLLSVLFRTFYYIRSDATEEDLSRNLLSMRRELSLLSRLIPLSAVYLLRDSWSTVIAFDASEQAGAVCYTQAYPDKVEELIESEDSLDSATLEQTKKAKPTQVPDTAVVSFVKRHKWTTAFAHHWKRRDHINALEATTAVLALNWATSHHVSRKRIVLISDSAVTIGALRKGRSSSPNLCLQCRQFGALSLAHNVEVILKHVPSEHNPADAPSRLRLL